MPWPPSRCQVDPEGPKLRVSTRRSTGSGPGEMGVQHAHLVPRSAFASRGSPFAKPNSLARPASADSVLRLQRRAGNLAVSSALGSSTVGQPLMVQRGGDPPKSREGYSLVGHITFTDASGELLQRWSVQLTEASMVGSRPKEGMYDVTVRHTKGASYTLAFDSHTAGAQDRQQQRRCRDAQEAHARHPRGVRQARAPEGPGRPDRHPTARREEGRHGNDVQAGQQVRLAGSDRSSAGRDRRTREGIRDTRGRQEYLALKQTIEALAALAKNSEALGQILDPDKLLLALLGIEENAALDALETWAAAEPEKSKKSGAAGKGGLVKVAARVAALLAKVRRVLHPVFEGRQAFRTALGLVAEGVEGVTLIDELVEMAQNPKRAEAEFAQLMDSFSEEAALAIQAQLEAAKGMVQLQVERFDKATDLLTYEELARAITDAATKLTPKHYRPVVWAAQKAGLLDLVSDNIVAPLIPKEALDAVNGVLGQFADQLAPAVKAAGKDLASVVDASGAAIETHLVGSLREAIIMPSRRSATRRVTSREELLEVGRLANSSRGDVVDPSRLALPGAGAPGNPLDRVPVHRDAGAERANDLLDSNAFTVGGHIYFAANQFAPERTEGRALLAHELTHVAQQRPTGNSGNVVVQRDWKSAVNALAKKVGGIAADTVKGLVRPKKRKSAAEAERLLKRVMKLVGQKVTPSGQPALPAEAYSYVRNRKGVIVRIRRKPEWAGSAVPKLRIEKGRIAVGSSWDWKAAARAKLRRALGAPAKQTDQAHHLVSLELRPHKVVALAERNGWDINGKENGYYLPVAVHGTSHPRYTKAVLAELEKILKAAGSTNWAAVEPLFDAMLQRLRKRLRGLVKSGQRLD